VTYTEESLRQLSALAGAVLGQDDLPSTLQAVTRIAVATIPGCEGSSLTAYRDGHPSVVAADDDWSRALDELQYAEREGPCLDAARTGNAFRVRDLAEDTRWPIYAERAVGLGARSMVSLPMSSDGKIVGALNMYCRTPDGFTAEEVALAELMAAQAGIAMQVAASFFQHRDLAEQMRQALASRARIEQAKGVLMGARGCTEEEAFDLLVELSQTSNRKLRDVAEAVVDSARGGAQPPA
jgi:GAF domain-containing protein